MLSNAAQTLTDQTAVADGGCLMLLCDSFVDCVPDGHVIVPCSLDLLSKSCLCKPETALTASDLD